MNLGLGRQGAGKDFVGHSVEVVSDVNQASCTCQKKNQMSTKHVRELDDATFQDTINRGVRPVLVDFWAPWCPPCDSLAPTIDAIAERFDGRADVAKVDIDQNPETAAAHRISSIPTVLIFRGGREVDRIVGLQPRSRYERALEAAGATQSVASNFK
jgi:thioredoxin 1